MPKTVEMATSLPGLIFALAIQAPDRPMLGFWRDGAWRQMSRGEFCQKVAKLAAGLRAQGVMPGDRVLLVSENRPEFMIADNAIMAIGAVTVPTYVTNTVADHAHVLRDSGARVAIVSTRILAERVLQAAPLDLLVGMEQLPPAPAETRAIPWAELEAVEADLAMLIAEVEEIPAGRLACLIYTSGTGGNPKGVMLPHRAMLTNCAGAKRLIDGIGVRHGRYLSFLPLSHSYEHTVGGFLMPACGYQVIFSRGADKLLADFAEHRPHLITTVPRLFEVIRERIMASLEKDGGLRLKLFRRAVTLGLRKLDGPPLNLF